MQKFNIKQLILKGKNIVKPYEIPNVGTIYVRPLTDLELGTAESELLTCIEDNVTTAYLLGKNEDPTGVRFDKIAIANIRVDIMIAYLAMKDFCDDIELADVEKLPGVKGIATFVRTLSGVVDLPDEKTIITTDDLKSFREIE